ncbi:hypothetical protein Q5P01_013181 [Channa striata]|uniref:VWFA domain-containing protein n=1 Tax=Channa striata TaxID=64152 RepID=A0AA88MJK4_CHASR|nr:hypothetical protein Q5P01_013181 [Channa striata]
MIPVVLLSVSEFTELPSVQEKLSSVVSTVEVKVTPITPTVPVERKPTGRDVVFLLDGSDGTRTGFPAMRDFVQRVVDTLSVDDDKDRVSVVQYSREPAVQFYLNTYTTKDEILDTVRGLRHKGGRPLNTGAALQYLRDNVFTASAGSRRLERVPQVLILLSGGRSSDSVDAPASALKQMGVQTFAIGTRSSDLSELQKISHDPSSTLSVSEFTELPSVQEKLSSVVSTVEVKVTPITPTVPVERKPTGRDVVFLLDGSDGTRTGFPAMRDFVQRVVDTLSVDDDKDRVSVVQYSREPAVQFYLNTYTTKDEILDTVRGSRRLERVPQVLILLSGGRSSDSVDAPASALKQMGVQTFAIGTRSSDLSELQKISHDPSSTLSVSEFTELPSVQEKLSSVVSTVEVKVTPITPTVPVERKPTGRDVVFLLDGSDGTRTGFPAMRDFVQRVVDTLSVDDDKDRVSVVQYSREPAVQFYLNTYTTKDEILDTVRGLRHKGGRPLNTGAALQYLRDNVFTASAGSRRLERVPQVLILLSGGRSSDSVDAPASALKQMGVQTFAIGTRSSDLSELQKISHDPSSTLSVSEFTELPSVQEKLSSVVSTVEVKVTPITPTVPVERKPTGRDVVFLLDGSDGTRTGFPAMRDFVQRVVDTLSVDDDKDRVSVVQYSREPAVQFYLNTYTTKDEILDTVRGSRRLERVPQVLILLSGGRSSDSVDAPASALKQMGVQTFAIGTRSSDLSELQKISHDPSSTLSVSEFTELPSVQEKLSSVVSTVEVKVTPITPTVPVERKPTGRDVVFLLDGSDGTRTGFPAMRDFVQRVVDTLSVDDEKDRVSVVQYSREPAVQFYLNTYTTKDEILDTVRGSRRLERVPQVLILLSGGRSSDSVDAPASALKQMGVQTFAIGTRSSDLSELQKISHDPSSTLSVSEFTELPSVQEKLSSVVSTVEVKVTPITPTVPVERKPTGRDVVFLLDGSDGTRTGFPAMRDFVQRVVDTLSVDDDKDRVSVVQYSREPAVQFYLNTYTTKDEILDTVRGLRHKGGRPLNTGAALQYLRDNVFTASAGSRRLERVPQVLILLSGGRSSDSVDAPASALKQMGVQTFAIGTRSSDLSELQKISHDPSSTLSVSEFTELPSVQEKLSSVVSTVEVKVTPITPTVPVERKPTGRDVVFLLDGSDGTRTGFPAMRDFVQRVVDTLSVDDDKDRVSVVQYSREPAVQFYLNTYTTKDEILDTVRGSRRLERVPQVLILLSGGRSSDSVDAPASALKQMGVQTFAIGTRSSDLSELQKISHDPSSTLSVSEFTELPSVQEKLSSVVSTVEVKVTPITPTVPVERKPTGRDVVFLLDGSDGTRTGFPAMRDFVQRVVDTLSVDDDKDRVSVVQYSREPAVQFYLNTYTTKDEILDTVRGSRRLERVPQVLILLSGGRSSDSVDAPASALKQMGVQTFAIGTRSSDLSELQKISHDPSSTLSVSEFTELPSVQEKLSSVVSTVEVKVTPITPTVPVERKPTGRDVVFLLDGSDGTRTGFPAMRDFVQRVVDTLSVDDDKDRVSVVQYSREPAVQFYLNTYTTKDEILDTVRGSRRLERVPQVLILLSGGRSSDSVDAPASALKQMGVQTFAIGTRSSDLSELQKISHDPSSTLSVSEFTELPSVQEKLSSVVSTVEVKVTPITPTVPVERKPTGRDVVFLLDGSDGTRTGFPAMRDFVQRVVDTLSVDDDKDRVSVVQYSREPAVQFYLNTYTTKDEILDTVRGSRRLERVPQVLILLSGGRSSDSVDAPASALKQMGVQTFAIGTRSSDLSELQKISHDPSSTLSVSEFTELPSVQEKLSSVVSTVEVKVTPITPTVPVERKPTGRDVVFLLDGSDGTRTGFPAMRDFVQRVVDTLSVDDDKDRVSVVQYSREPAVQFYLNTYTTKDEILDTVRGSRRLERVPQVLILLSGGRSSDSVDAPASALKQMGVQTFAIGTRSSDLSELQKISHDPSSTLSVSEFTELPSVQEKLSSVVSTVEVKVTPITPTVPVERKPTGRDVVFLLDGSDGTRTGFPAMRDFVQRVVDTLSVDDDKDRVSVVQYSREPAVQFYLNTYTTKDEILDTVRGLRTQGRKTPQHWSRSPVLEDNVFTASAGSRRLERVPQVLILLSGGRSSDSVDAPASALKQMGVQTFAIGTRSSDLSELQKISHDPSSTLSVSEFTELPSVQEKLSSVVSTVEVKVTPITPTVPVERKPTGRDVVFLLDGSDGTRTGFPAMRDFVQRVVDTLSVDDDKDRVSVVQYSREPAVQFYLNTYTTKDEILDTVRGLRHKGGRPLNTGAALQYLRTMSSLPLQEAGAWKEFHRC